MTYKIECPRCPVCNTRSTMVLSPMQAFCEVTDCPALSWDMTKTRSENLDGVNFIDPPDGAPMTESPPGTPEGPRP